MSSLPEPPTASPASGIELDLTLLIPCLNEESRVGSTLATVQAAMAVISRTYEVIVVDDGSTDATASVVEEFCRLHPEMPVRLHRNPRNLGLARSFVDASFQARGRYYRLICGDNVEPTESMIAILKLLGHADIVVPYYPVVPGKSRGRMAISSIYTFFVNLFSGYSLKYYNGHPLYRRYDVMRWASYNYGFGFQADLLTMLLDEGATCVELPISGVHREKSRGASPLNLRNFLSVAHSLLEICLRRLKRMIYGKRAPASYFPPTSAALASSPPPGPPGEADTRAAPATREPQYQRSLELESEGGLTALGLMTNQAWQDDPRHLVFTLSRYKFVAKMLADREHALEVGCADAFGTRIVVQGVKRLTAVDFDPVFVADVRKRMDPKWRFDCRQHDMLSGPVPGGFDAAYALDVIEHISPAHELLFLDNMVKSLTAHGMLLLGCPSIQSQAYASSASKAGHVNCKDGPGMRLLLSRAFHNVLVFSMNDEVVHTGYLPMAHYIIGLGFDRKTR